MARQLDKVDLARAESDAAAAEMAVAFDQLIERLLSLGDRRAAELAARLLVTVDHVIQRQSTMADTAIEALSNLHAKQLHILGSSPKDAAQRLLKAAGYQ